MRILKPYGPRGTAMVALAAVALLRAAEYLKWAAPGYTPTALREIAAVMPTWTWGILWGVTGLYLLFAAFRKRHAAALGMVAGMSALWAGAYTYTAIIRTPEQGFSQAWLTALVYISLFVIVVALARMINPVRLKGAADA